MCANPPADNKPPPKLHANQINDVDSLEHHPIGSWVSNSDEADQHTADEIAAAENTEVLHLEEYFPVDTDF